MALGQGCPWKGKCQAKVTAYERKEFCNSDTGCDRCKHRPKNSNNEKVEISHDRKVSVHEGQQFDKTVVIVILLLIFLGWIVTNANALFR